MINFLDLQEINLNIKNDLKLAFDEVLKSGWFVNGPQLREFEKEFANFCKTQYCVGTGNGFDALVMILLAWKKMGKIKEGDKCIVPSNTFIASVLAIMHAGLVPVVVNPKKGGFNIDCETIMRVFETHSRIKAIMPVHLYGEMADVKNIKQFAKENNLLLIEDAAQAHGATFEGKPAGCWGDAAAFSFYPGKNLGALGDAGAIVSDDAELIDTVRSIGNYGSKHKYRHEIKGLNSRLDEMQAAFLRVKLKNLNNDIKIRKCIANIYLKNISNPIIDLPIIRSEESHVFHLFVIKTNHRDELKKYLLKNNIETSIHYPISICRQKAFKNEKFIQTDEVYLDDDKILSLPIGPHLSTKDALYVTKKLNNFRLLD